MVDDNHVADDNEKTTRVRADLTSTCDAQTADHFFPLHGVTVCVCRRPSAAATSRKTLTAVTQQSIACLAPTL